MYHIDWQQKNPMKFTVRVSKKHPQKVCFQCVFFFFGQISSTKPQPNPNRVTVPIGSETSCFCLRNAKPVDRLLEPNFCRKGRVGCWLVGWEEKIQENLRLKKNVFVIHGRSGGAIM